MAWPTPAARTVSRAKHQRSRQLVYDSCARIASAQELMSQAHRSMARPRYLKIVCAWCQQTIRWERSVQIACGWQISHSICFACFASVFQELDPSPPLPFKPRHDLLALPHFW
jgi:hypothetical protein